MLRQIADCLAPQWLFAADPLITLGWLFVILALAIAGLITVIVWPLDCNAARSRRNLRSEARDLPRIPAGSVRGKA
jgi:hypothetical protein